jgi:hypothetical protein
MPRYAVKIAEIQLVSDKPITEEERKRAVAEWKRTYKGAIMVTADGLCVVTA